jgi:hypothetical protein
MSIDTARNAQLHTALTRLRNKVREFGLAFFKKRQTELDPGGMRDEMEREFFARSSRCPW